eukprot:627645_1
MSEFGCSEYGRRFDYTHNKCRDILFSILFYLQITAIIIAIVYLFVITIPEVNKDRDPKIDIVNQLTGIWITIPICSMSGLCIGLIWMEAIKAFPDKIIQYIFFFAIGCWTVLFIIGLIALNLAMIIVGAVMTVCTSLYVWRVWSLIPFSSFLLAMATRQLNIYGDVLWMYILGILLHLCWVYLWGTLCGAYLSVYLEDRNKLLLSLMLVSLYWSIMVFNNVIRVSACSAAGTWYFSLKSTTHNRTNASLKSTLGASFGSICLGSIFASVLEGLRVIVTTLARDCEQERCACCCSVMKPLIENMCRYFNGYSWAHVAIYGNGYITSAKQTSKMFKHCGIKPIINNEITGSVTFCGGVVAGLVSAAIGYGLGLVFYYTSQNQTIRHVFPVALGTYGGIIGFTFTSCILVLVRGFVITLLVCYAENGLTMQENRPDEYKEMIEQEPRFINVTKNVVPWTETEQLTATM